MPDQVGTMLRTQAREAYGDAWSPAYRASAPGRLELLGNHVDYNGGLVLAGAIDRRVTALAGIGRMGADSIALFAPDVSPDVTVVGPKTATQSMDGNSTTPAHYLAGIVQALDEFKLPVRDQLQIVVSGNVPLGFGMSSSAALCLSLALLVSERDLDDHTLVAIARRAEHITGAPVGAMDQSASVTGGVILFDGADASIEPLTPDLGEHIFAIANSGVHHAVGQSSYPDRVRESEEALRTIVDVTDLDVEHLGQIRPKDIDQNNAAIKSALSPLLWKRVTHVVSEVERVREGSNAVRESDWDRFGSLMTESGRSSAENYEISHSEVEALVSMLLDVDAVLGARMMGGGEGGPALALLHRDAIDEVRQTLQDRFFRTRELDSDTAFEACTFGDGASFARVEGA